MKKEMELEPLVIPEFVADWWEQEGDSVKLYGELRVEKKDKFDLISKFQAIGLGNYLSKVEDWIKENDSAFLDLVNGKSYEVDKEPLYVLKLPYIDYFYTKVEEENRIGIGRPKSIKEMSSYHFTEKEILTKIPDIPRSLWIKLEVAE